MQRDRLGLDYSQVSVSKVASFGLGSLIHLQWLSVSGAIQPLFHVLYRIFRGFLYPA